MTIERSDSKKFVFPLALLSNEDQIYVRGTLKSLSQTQTYSKQSQTPLSSSDTLPIWSPTIVSNCGRKMHRTIGLKGRID